MTARKPAWPEPSLDAFGEGARDDWMRYGLRARDEAHGAATLEATRDATTDATSGATSGVTRAATRRTVARVRPAWHSGPEEADGPLDDDLFLEYSHENGVEAHKPAGTRRSSRFVANLATVGAVGALGVVVLIVGLVTSSMGGSALASPSRSDRHTGAASFFTPNPGRTSKPGHVTVVVNLPSRIATIDRNQPLDDGTLMYLTGSADAVAIDPGAGTVRTAYGGPAFANGIRRAAVRSGLWVSSWSDQGLPCGPACWTSATTYRVDTVTGAVTRTLTGAYMLGSTVDSIWVASGNSIERIDPSTGDQLATIAWPDRGEPRLGCGSLWSFQVGATGTTLEQIDIASGAVQSTSPLPSEVGYGPFYFINSAQCWMMSGSNGVSSGSTVLVQLQATGATQSTWQFSDKSILTVDGEFWLYTAGGLVQRFEPNSGSGFGTPYLLPVQPPDGDPTRLFGDLGTLWMIDGTKLTGFDIPTGSTRVNG